MHQQASSSTVDLKLGKSSIKSLCLTKRMEDINCWQRSPPTVPPLAKNSLQSKKKAALFKLDAPKLLKRKAACCCFSMALLQLGAAFSTTQCHENARSVLKVVTQTSFRKYQKSSNNARSFYTSKTNSGQDQSSDLIQIDFSVLHFGYSSISKRFFLVGNILIQQKDGA